MTSNARLHEPAPCFERFLALLCVLIVSAGLHAHAADSTALWVADQREIKRVDLSTNQFAQTIALTRTAEDIAFDGHRNVLWVLSSRHLWKFNPAGTLISGLDLNPLVPPGEALQRLALDPQDGSVWVACDKRTLFQVSAQGNVTFQWFAPRDMANIAIDPDRSLWILAAGFIYHLSPTGTLLHTLALPATMTEPAHLAVDGWGEYLWVADRTQLLRLNAADLSASPLVVQLPSSISINNPVTSVLTRPVDGTLWLASNQVLLIFQRDAALTRSVSLSSFGFGRGPFLAFDNLTASLWLGGGKAIGRLAPNGDFVASPPESVDVSALSTGPLRVVPTLTLIEPANNALTANARPTFRLGLGAECNGVGCSLSAGYFQSLVVTALLNGQAVGHLFAIGPSTAEFQPSAALPEGPSNFQATATDVFGQASNQVVGQVTVDTIPPRLTSLTPPSGSVLSSFSVTVSGQIDDATGSVTLQTGSGTPLFTGASSFNFSITLAPGVNNFQLVLRDLAGNLATIPYQLTSGVRLAIDSPTNGASVSGDKMLVTGTIEGPENSGVTVNGNVAAIDASGRFFASVVLNSGSNTITANATTPAGQTASHSVTVTSDGVVSPVMLAVGPVRGIAPMTTAIYVFNGSPRAVTIAINNNAAGTVSSGSSETYPLSFSAPGTFSIHVSAADVNGVLASLREMVVVMESAQVDRLLQGVWRGMNDALVAGNKAGAINFLTSTAQEKYEPVFSVLLPRMSQIVASYSPLGLVRMTPEVAEYVVGRTYNGSRQLYFIYFLLDGDGVWRLDSM